MNKRVISTILINLILISVFGQEIVISTPKQRLLQSLENYIEICTNGYSFESLYVTNSNGTIRKTESGFIIQPKKPGNTSLNVYSINSADTIFIGSKLLEVHPLIKYSEVYLPGANGSLISKKSLISQIGLDAQLINQDISLRYNISSYRLIILRGDSLIFTREFDSFKFGDEIKDAFKLTISGDKIYFLDIFVQSIEDNEKTMKLNDISLIVD